MGFSCSPLPLLFMPSFILCFFFYSLWDLFQTSNILLSPSFQIGLCAPRLYFSAPFGASSQTQAGIKSLLRCGRGEVWGELKAPRDPWQHYLGLAGARSRENLPWHLFFLCFISPRLKNTFGWTLCRDVTAFGKGSVACEERCH